MASGTPPTLHTVIPEVVGTAYPGPLSVQTSSSYSGIQKGFPRAEAQASV